MAERAKSKAVRHSRLRLATAASAVEPPEAKQPVMHLAPASENKFSNNLLNKLVLARGSGDPALIGNLTRAAQILGLNAELRMKEEELKSERAQSEANQKELEAHAKELEATKELLASSTQALKEEAHRLRRDAEKASTSSVVAVLRWLLTNNNNNPPHHRPRPRGTQR